MENFATFLEFENGVIVDNESDLRPTVSTVKSIVEPVVFQNKLSGKINVECSDDKVTIVYIGVKPFECVPELIKAIRMSTSSENFG